MFYREGSQALPFDKPHHGLGAGGACLANSEKYSEVDISGLLLLQGTAKLTTTYAGLNTITPYNPTSDLAAQSRSEAGKRPIPITPMMERVSAAVKPGE